MGQSGIVRASRGVRWNRVAPFLRKRRQGLRLDEHADARADDPAQPGSEPAEGTALLAKRLREMEWPKPPEGARERCLEEIMNRVRKPDVDASETA